MTQCPRCGGGISVGQEFCLECGLKLPVAGRVGSVPLDRRKASLAILLAGIVAVAGGALAIGLTRETATATTILTATGGSETVKAPTVTNASRLEEWPLERSGWTIVLVSVPKVEGRDAAVARAADARQKGLKGVGVLDSSKFASLHPGYWMVFSGFYPSEPEAASHLRDAKSVQRGARTARISR
ncbi:hypothetical protein [Gaiella sp.]|uniref:hypothetical protein n=1 Tax=Gaiella sp. TaxID=2663207 RepID=UPI0032654FB1